MSHEQLTAFEHILLGLLCLSPSSGYDLKQKFATTPMGVYQPSSGALYPALRRLAEKELIGTQAGAGDSARRRRAYEPTEAGRAAHRRWLCAPVHPATVAQDLGLHLVRFSMMEPVLSRDEVLTFLRQLRDALAAFTAGLERHAEQPVGAGRHPILALRHGIAVHSASRDWAERAIAALSESDSARRA